MWFQIWRCIAKIEKYAWTNATHTRIHTWHTRHTWYLRRRDTTIARTRCSWRRKLYCWQCNPSSLEQHNYQQGPTQIWRHIEDQTHRERWPSVFITVYTYPTVLYHSTTAKAAYTIRSPINIQAIWPAENSWNEIRNAKDSWEAWIPRINLWALSQDKNCTQTTPCNNGSG